MTDYEKILYSTFKEAIGKGYKGAMSAAIFNENGLLYSLHCGHADKAAAKKADDDTLFMVGSNTKILTVLGLFRLYEEGKLSLDDPLTRFIPEFTVKSRFQTRPITIADLMMHRAGIQCDLYEYMSGNVHRYTDIIPAFRETYMTMEPGVMFSYSNLGYTLLGIVAERISGKSYTEFIRETVLDPLGIEAYFAMEKDLPKEIMSRAAKCYTESGQRTYDPLGSLFPAGPCTYMTVRGLAALGQLLLCKGRINGRQLFRQETIELMETLRAGDEMDSQMACIGYGLYHHNLSLEYKTGRALGHGGNTVYQHSAFDFLPEEKIGVIAVSNYGPATKLTHTVQRRIFNKWLELSGYPRKDSVECAPVITDMHGYEASYDSRFGPLHFTVENGELFTRINDVKTRLVLMDDGWLHCEAVDEGGGLPEAAAAIKGLCLKEMPYYGRKVLFMRQDGVINAAGIAYEEVLENEEWNKAEGVYYVRNGRQKKLIGKMELHRIDGLPVLTVYEEGNEKDYYLSCLNDREAVVKGFGRDTRQTVFLEKKNGKYRISCDGVLGIRRE